MGRSKSKTQQVCRKNTCVLFVCGTTGYKVPSHNLFLGCLVCLWLVNHASLAAFTLTVTRCSPPHPPLFLTCCCLYLSISPSGNIIVARARLQSVPSALHTELSKYACDRQQSHSFTLLGGINSVSRDGCRNKVK